jgi:AbrB family looped-hinge helix DNA binding protein
MARAKGAGACCAAGQRAGFFVEGVASIDGRGQMVLPKEVRERADIKAGDRLAVVSCEAGGRVCCIALVKADALAGLVGDLLGPSLGGALEGRGRGGGHGKYTGIER